MKSAGIKIGNYIRDKVIPNGMTVTEAARRLGVGRQSLSNLLNNRSALSRKMAERLELAFRVSGEELLRRQQEARSTKANIDSSPLRREVRRYMPQLVKITSGEIESWGSRINSRTELPVLIRQLIHSTCSQPVNVDFPGYDDAESPGWDGYSDIGVGNSWVPSGKSYWELSTAKSPIKKANTDFQKRTQQTTFNEKRTSTFVFVTTNRWLDKDQWLKKNEGVGSWRDIRVIDASNLEQWIEQSPSVQVWLDDVMGRYILEGITSIQQCWRLWQNGIQVDFKPEMFSEPAAEHGERILNFLSNDESGVFRLVADSCEEALAFLAATLKLSGSRGQEIEAKCVVITNSKAMARLNHASDGFIPIVANPAIEKQVAQLQREPKYLVVDYRSTANPCRDVVLGSLSEEAFQQAFGSMGLSDCWIRDRLREFNRSFSVIRRDLASIPALKTPPWAKRSERAESLLAMTLLGGWDDTNRGDRVLIAKIADKPYAGVKNDFEELLRSEQCPVWSTGNYIGVKSKIDVIHVLAHEGLIQTTQIQRFFDVAKQLLSCETMGLFANNRTTPSKEHTQLWVSELVMRGVKDSLAIISTLIGEGRPLNLGSYPNKQIDQLKVKLLKELLSEFGVKSLDRNWIHLPLYAELDPNEVLSHLEDDLRHPESKTLSKLKEAVDFWEFLDESIHIYQTLEVLASQTNKDLTTRILDVYGRLVSQEIEYRSPTKGIRSLESVINYCIPQELGVNGQIQALSFLSEKFKEVAWEVASRQFRPQDQDGHVPTSPIWLDYDRHTLQTKVKQEDTDPDQFRQHCLNYCVDLDSIELNKAVYMVDRIEQLDLTQRQKLQSQIYRWAGSASDHEKSKLTDVVRIKVNSLEAWSTNPREASSGGHYQVCVSFLQEICESVQPKDVVFKHAWLFKDSWNYRPYSYLDEPDGVQSYKLSLDRLRESALTEIQSERGHTGVLKLAFGDTDPQNVGRTLARCSRTSQDLDDFIRIALKDGDLTKSHKHQQLLRGFFSNLDPSKSLDLVKLLWSELSVEVRTGLLGLQTPNSAVRDFIVTLDAHEYSAYWQSIEPRNWTASSDLLNIAIPNLIQVDRTDVAFEYGRHDWTRVTTTNIHRLLISLSEAKTTRDHHNPTHFAYHEIDSVHRAIQVLRERKELEISELAELEVLFVDQFSQREHNIPSLVEQISREPSFFARAVSGSTRAKMACEGQFRDGKNTLKSSDGCDTVLRKLPFVGNKDLSSAMDYQALELWLEQTQKSFKYYDCQLSGFYHLGVLFSKVEETTEEVWPCLSILKSIEELLEPKPLERGDAGEHFKAGFISGCRNQRVALRIDDLEDQENTQKLRYKSTIRACAFKYPKTQRMFERLVSICDVVSDFWHHESELSESLPS